MRLRWIEFIPFIGLIVSLSTFNSFLVFEILSNAELDWEERGVLEGAWLLNFGLIAIFGSFYFRKRESRFFQREFKEILSDAVLAYGLLTSLLGGLNMTDALNRGQVGQIISQTLLQAFVALVGVLFFTSVLYFLMHERLRKGKAISCPSCNKQVYDKFTFCPQCSFPLHKRCPYCKSEVFADFQYCPHCAKILPHVKDQISTPER
ncbi:MAG: hypothetical protein HeimC3_15700 [Candidatus Heimdallarchaeota archaeon LC_3]|nr:MAG: hypothetical protein HeimC3_15700 [Candidatus Heimdallarchaeota archaeon LC_3]